MVTRTQNQRAKLQIALAAISFASAFALSSYREDLYKFFYVEPRILIMVIGALVAQGVAYVLLLYLRGDIAVSFLDSLLTKRTNRGSTEYFASMRKQDVELEKLGSELASVQARIAAIGNSSVSATVDYEKLIDSLRAHVTGTLAAELSSQFKYEAQNAAHLSLARRTFQDTEARLRTEIGSLTRRGNLNLVIGVVTTGFAVSLLVYMVLGASSTFENWPQLLSHYIPRITTVVFVEIFAFFFLRLYKSSLIEIKYYQDELTTLASQHIAFEAAHAAGEDEAKLAVIRQLVRASRNKDDKSATDEPPTPGNLKELSEILERATKLVVSSAKNAKAD